MNLVQINERLKDLPMQVLQQYANGMNPEVPPYLALGELQRRETAQKQMATAQGAAQGPQPSVKEQVEQKAGLMQLQQMQQQQMAQQMQQPRGPMPVPAGAPQPEPQPEAMMARGGLAGIPVRRDMFEYARGGIIAFQAGGDTMGTPSLEQQELTSQAAAITDEMVAERRNKAKMIAELEKKLAFLTNAGAPQAEEVRLQLDQLKESGAPERPTAAPPVRQAPPTKAAAGPDSGLLAAAKAKATDVAQPPSATRPTNTRPAATPPVAPPTQAGDQPNVSPFLAEAAAMARDKPVAPTAEGVIKDVNALMPAGLQEAAQQRLLANQRARADERKALFEKSRPSGLDDLIRVFGQAGQYKGMSGLAPAETALQQQRRAEELAFQKEQNELLTAIEGRGTAADKGVFEARTSAMDKATKAFHDRMMTNTKALADLSGVDQSRIDNALRNLNQMEVEKLRSATQNRSLNEKLKFEADFMAIKAKAMKLAEEGDAPGAARLEAQASSMLASRGLGSAGAGTAAVGADNAQTRRLRDAVKDIDSRLETMDPKSPEFKPLQAQRDKLSKLIVERAIGEAGSVGGASGPKIGDVQQGYRFKGGNPADQSNWEKVK